MILCIMWLCVVHMYTCNDVMCIVYIHEKWEGQEGKSESLKLILLFYECP